LTSEDCESTNRAGPPNLQKLKAKGREAGQAAIARQKEKEADDERKVAVALREWAEKARDRARAVLDAMTSDSIRNSLTFQTEISEEQKKFLAEASGALRVLSGNHTLLISTRNAGSPGLEGRRH
jgi:hypothetical protein